MCVCCRVLICKRKRIEEKRREKKVGKKRERTSRGERERETISITVIAVPPCIERHLKIEKKGGPAWINRE